MATQLSAVTMIGTTGQGARDGLRFVQIYFGLPLAMVIHGVTLVPLLHGSGVYTAYEYLERRFDAKTRSLTAFLFLLSRGMSCGTIMAAPTTPALAKFPSNQTNPNSANSGSAKKLGCGLITATAWRRRQIIHALIGTIKKP
jgi:hypothetical protein